MVSLTGENAAVFLKCDCPLFLQDNTTCTDTKISCSEFNWLCLYSDIRNCRIVVSCSNFQLEQQIFLRLFYILNSCLERMGEGRCGTAQSKHSGHLIIYFLLLFLNKKWENRKDFNTCKVLPGLVFLICFKTVFCNLKESLVIPSFGGSVSLLFSWRFTCFSCFVWETC